MAAALALAALGSTALAPGASAKPKKQKPALNRATEPVVLTGDRLTGLLGADPAAVAAFRYKPKGRRWIRIPVQVDERAIVDFGQNPASGSVPLTGARTVYGTPPLGQSALQYTDPNTFVGPDPDASVDANDEVVFMASDAGARAPAKGGKPGAKMKGAQRVTVRDPLTGAKGYAYVFRAAKKVLNKKGKKSKRVAAPTLDYVRYSFKPLSGDYRATYDRRSGPNPEASVAVTPFYTAGFSDRWYFDQLRISDRASGADILDGFKFAFSSGGCGRSEATFNSAEGAFVANIDGPVRAIRSYVGANSGPYTERTDLLYRQRHDIITNLRVHPVPGPFTHYDMSPAAAGMAYLDATHPAPVTVDGSPDAYAASAPPAWHLWRGNQGSFFVSERFTSSIQLDSSAHAFYEDNSTAPSFQQCWGDADAFGAAGQTITSSVPNTDVGSSDFVRGASVNIYAQPGLSAADAAKWSAQLAAPVSASGSRFKR